MSRLLLVLALVAIAATALFFVTRGRRNTPRRENPRAPELPAPVAAPQAPAAQPPVDAAVLPELLGRLHALALGNARAADPHALPDPAHMPVLLAASSAIARIGIEPSYTPRRPSLLPQILEAINDEDASLRGLGRVISQDPELTSELLRTANSPLYRVSHAPVESVERAAALMGTRGIRTLITTSLMKPLAGSGAAGRFGEVIWEHSLYSATAAEAFAARNQDCDPYTAHLLGLLHGLGSVAVYRALLNQYATHPGLAPDAVALSQALGTQSGLTAKRIAANWGLSEKTQEALEAQSSAAPATAESALARALLFGRAAGALILLCKREGLDAEEARARLAAAGYAAPTLDRIWDRLVKAYVSAK